MELPKWNIHFQTNWDPLNYAELSKLPQQAFLSEFLHLDLIRHTVWQSSDEHRLCGSKWYLAFTQLSKE